MNTSSMIRTAGCIVALAAPLAFAAAAQAAPAGDPPRVVVTYNPASVATEKGAADLYRRIARAAAQVCPDGSGYSRAVDALAQQCRQDAIARAVAAVPDRHLVEVAAAHAQRG